MTTSARQRIAPEPDGASPLGRRTVPLVALPGGQRDVLGRRASTSGRVFLLGDVVAVVVCTAATAVVLSMPVSTTAISFLVLAGCSVFSLHLAGCYDERVYHRANGLSTRLLFGLGLAVLMSSTASFFLPALGLESPVVFVYHVLVLPTLFMWRRTGGERIRPTIAATPVAVLGFGPGVKELGTTIAQDKSYRVDIEFKVLPNGEIQVAKHGREAGRRPATDISKLVAIAGIQLIAVAPLGFAGRKDLYKQLILCKQMGVDVKDIVPCIEMLTRRFPVRHVEDGRVASSSRFQIWGHAFDDRLKRLIDVAVSSFGLLATLPLLALMAAAIRLTCGNPVLYRQHRVGLHGRQFTMYKFRTMVVSNGWIGPTAPNDPRITWIGRFLRATHWDELPQLWNVLRGDMSLVGPRPCICELVEGYRENIPYYNLRQLVKPGITGLAQIECRYSDTISGTEAKLEYDLHYVRYRNTLWDMRILLKTLFVAARTPAEPPSDRTFEKAAR